MEKLLPAKEALKFQILRSIYAAGWIQGVTLQPSDLITSPVEWGWKYSKDKSFAVDWCRAYHINLND